MGLTWVREATARWDAAKQRIVGGAPAGVFHLGDPRPDGVVPGDWWRVEQDGQTVGFGWMDVTWGDAEILLAVDPDAQRSGVGTWILDQLASEASHRGLRYLMNVVPAQHPRPAALTAWLVARGFQPAGEAGDLLKRPVPAEAP